ncbi:uncharacterized protein [Drosophila bipectinata]|uniref:uncharacterized protein n=1 Tax=Drosophila bipectinata TaxID=42026 RepID=UPI0038B3C502
MAKTARDIAIFVSIIQGYLFYISTPKYDIPATWNRNYGAEDVHRFPKNARFMQTCCLI